MFPVFVSLQLAVHFHPSVSLFAKTILQVKLYSLFHRRNKELLCRDITALAGSLFSSSLVVFGVNVLLVSSVNMLYMSQECCVLFPQGDSIQYSGDPLQDFTLIRFLDRFVFRNPKQLKEKRNKYRLYNVFLLCLWCKTKTHESREKQRFHIL